MKNLETLYNNSLQDNENLYLFFNIGLNKYSLSITEVVETMKLPMLDYPQKLANNIIGLLNYNNFTINVLDLRFYLDIKVTPYSISNQLLIVKTDESIFGLIIDKVEGIFSLDQSKIEPFDFHEPDRIIKFIYKEGNDTLSVINLNAIENKIKEGVEQSDIDIPSLLPNDDDSRYKLMQRRQFLQEKSDLYLATDILAQDKFISFSLNKAQYCINIEYVKEFLKNYLITKIPGNFDYIAGIIALRGDFITIVNIKNFLGLEEKLSDVNYLDNKNNLIILEIPDYKIGFLVDEIFRIISIPEESITKEHHNPNKYILSEVVLEDDLYTILNIKTILSDEKFYIEDTF